eukprot:2174039-Rhodomonas_salina.1
MVLSACYGMSRTDFPIAYCSVYCSVGRDRAGYQLRYLLRACYGMSGTDVGCGVSISSMRLLRYITHRRYVGGYRICYGVSRTDFLYSATVSATACPVPSSRMRQLYLLRCARY